MIIVILTKNYGYNFTGATLATNTLAKKWCKHTDVWQIFVLTFNIGKYDHDNKIDVRLCKNHRNLREEAERLNSKDTIYYSDDHLGYLLKGFHYIHTYHGNWPDARYLNKEYFFKSFFFIHWYKKTIQSAEYVVNVSDYMEYFTKRYNNNSVVIRNGIDKNKNSQLYRRINTSNNVIMIGNVDKRKYGKLIDIVRILPKNINIDIYGNILDKKIYKKYKKYSQIHFMGYIPFDEIDLQKYSCCLSVSLIENLPISLTEIVIHHIPVIAIDAGGIKEIVTHDNGTVFNADEIVDIKNAVVDICEGKRKYIFNNSNLNEFDWDVSEKKYIELFRKVIGSK